MKRISVLFATMILASTVSMAQTGSSTYDVTPQIQVSGVGKVNVTPDRVIIHIGVENKGDSPVSAKEENNKAIAKVLKYIKSLKIDDKDIQTQRVNLYKSSDSKIRKDYYVTSQTIKITLRDIDKYEQLMLGVMDAGVNRIDGVQFESSKAASYENEARTLAVQEAKQKATDYANALGQKVGKAILVSDGGSYAPPVVRPMYMMKSAGMGADAMDETLAVGEIEVVSNVSISFSLE
ncbi:SIMPL domain-containing protein [Myroides injenensis]|uniref:SIMPL domain-containing protein n=1 Tax=Myroides injenensis TaxID=1183151 RepID=UPI00028A09F5|nr:SIMPL domain-containing protein [Myroides injenensis]